MALKLVFLPQNRKNHPAPGGYVPSVTRLSCNGWFSTVPKLDIFWAKNIYFWFKPLSLRKTLVALLVAFTSAGRFFKLFYGQHTKRPYDSTVDLSKKREFWNVRRSAKREFWNAHFPVALPLKPLRTNFQLDSLTFTRRAKRFFIFRIYERISSNN